MKKEKIIGKKQILMFTMVLALVAAVWLNVKYSTDGSDFMATSSINDAKLGEAKYVAASSALSEPNDYFSKTRNEREESREQETELLEETIESVKSSEEAKNSAVVQLSKLTDRMEMEASIESLVKAKGFEDALAILTDDSCNVVVRSKEELKKDETVQILDIVNSISKINFENIKIVAVK